MDKKNTYKYVKHIMTAITMLITLFCCEKQEQKDELVKSENYLLKEWIGPYGGVPEFDKMKIKDIPSAIKEGIEICLNEVDKIANNEAEPTFENTVAEYERAGKEFNRANQFYSLVCNNLSTPESRKIELELEPIISEFGLKVLQNTKLFKRIKSVYDSSQKKPLEKEEQRLVEILYFRFIKNGAELGINKKKRYTEINKQLSILYTKFSSNVLHDEENYVTYLTDKQLDGLPEDYVLSSARIAEKKGHKGSYAVTNTRSSMDPFLTFSTNRSIRRQVWENYYSRGNNGDEWDNKEIIKEILKLRLERVKLLGFNNFIEWKLIDKMAKKPENAMNLLMQIWPKAIARVKEEVKDMQKIADGSNANIKIEPWDYRFYAEKVRKDKYDLDSDEIKQYLQLNKLTEAMHYVADRLFGFEFKEVEKDKVPVFQEDVRVWEVNRKETGENIGLWYLDPYARDGKRSGAWASSFRSHSTFDGKKNVLSTNNSNFVKPAQGKPTLLSWNDAETFFHEFGHALHFLSSSVSYPTLNGGIVDYTEFQSQLLERWLLTDGVIDRYLIHYKTGKPIPAGLVKKIKKASKFNQGFETTEYLASAIVDLKFHLANPDKIEVNEFESNTLKTLNMPDEICMRHRPTHFQHIFSTESYAASYYSYIWAEVLTSDAYEYFASVPGGFYDEELAKKLVKYLFAPRNSIDPNEAYRLFRGRDAKIDALLRDRGFQ